MQVDGQIGLPIQSTACVPAEWYKRYSRHFEDERLPHCKTGRELILGISGGITLWVVVSVILAVAGGWLGGRIAG